MQPSYFLRRLFDVSCSAIGLVLLTPVFAAIALIIVVDDRWPIIFSQTRIGRSGRPFRLWKFRTMRLGSYGSMITATGDNRITRAGARLRKYKLDELPQLFNVLKGDMSLVGPRPELPSHVQMQVPIWQAVLQTRPGITGLATLLYRDEEKIIAKSSDHDAFYRQSVLPAKLMLNLAYLVSRSFWQDVKLILITIRCSFFPGSFHPDLIAKSFGNGVGNEYELHPLSSTIDR